MRADHGHGDDAASRVLPGLAAPVQGRSPSRTPNTFAPRSADLEAAVGHEPLEHLVDDTQQERDQRGRRRSRRAALDERAEQPPDGQEDERVLHEMRDLVDPRVAQRDVEDPACAEVLGREQQRQPDDARQHGPVRSATCRNRLVRSSRRCPASNVRCPVPGRTVPDARRRGTAAQDGPVGRRSRHPRGTEACSATSTRGRPAAGTRDAEQPPSRLEFAARSRDDAGHRARRSPLDRISPPSVSSIVRPMNAMAIGC